MGVYENVFQGGDQALAEDVRDGIVYANGDSVGNVVLPVESDVRELIEYGSFDGVNSEFTGTLVAGEGIPQYPSQSNVRDGVTYGTEDVLQFTGNVTDALQSVVVEGVMYGANGLEFTGSLVIPGVTDPMHQNIRVIRGDDYLASTVPPRAIEWHPPEGTSWPDLSNAQSILFRAVNEFGYLEAIPVAIDAGQTDQFLRMELTSDDTKSILSGVSRYDVEFVASDGNVFTLARGDLITEMTYTNP